MLAGSVGRSGKRFGRGHVQALSATAPPPPPLPSPLSTGSGAVSGHVVWWPLAVQEAVAGEETPATQSAVEG